MEKMKIPYGCWDQILDLGKCNNACRCLPRTPIVLECVDCGNVFKIPFDKWLELKEAEVKGECDYLIVSVMFEILPITKKEKEENN